MWWRKKIRPIIILMSINYFLGDEGRRSQKQTFARRQWTQIFLFLFFSQHLFQLFWSRMFDVNLFFLEMKVETLKSKLFLEDNGHNFAVFVLFSKSFPINLINNVWCQSNIFSEKNVEGLKSELLLEDNEHNIWCFCFYLNIFSNQFYCWCLLLI